VDFNGEDILQSYRNQLQSAKLSAEECEEFLSDLSTGLKGYTYFEE
jgi:arginine decarboxylase-like protein